jgi:hypothetical protein
MSLNEMNNPNAAPGDGRGETRIAKQKESNPHDDGWPEELTLLLKSLQTKGLSTSEIATRLNETKLFHTLSRSAVAGKIHRLRKQKPDSPNTPLLVGAVPDSREERQRKIELLKNRAGVPPLDSFQALTPEEVLRGHTSELSKIPQGLFRPALRFADSLEREIAAYDRDPRTPWDVERKKIVARVLAIIARAEDDTIPEPVRRAAIRAIDIIDISQQQRKVVRPLLPAIMGPDVAMPDLAPAEQLRLLSWQQRFKEKHGISTNY